MICSTTNTCSVPSLDCVEHLLLSTAAALTDQTVDFAAVATPKVTLEQVVKDTWAGTTTHTQHVGWLNALRALLATPEVDGNAWLELTDATFVSILQQG